MSNKASDINVSSIEEDIKILENLKSYLNLLVYEGKDKIIYNDLLWDEKTVDCINAIEHLINNYTRQKQKNEELKSKFLDTMKGANIIKKETPEYIKENYIPKQKIKDKIQEIKEDKESKYYYMFLENRDIKKTLEVLEKLLQESEGK